VVLAVATLHALALLGLAAAGAAAPAAAGPAMAPKLTMAVRTVAVAPAAPPAAPPAEPPAEPLAEPPAEPLAESPAESPAEVATAPAPRVAAPATPTPTPAPADAPTAAAVPQALPALSAPSPDPAPPPDADSPATTAAATLVASAGPIAPDPVADTTAALPRYRASLPPPFEAWFEMRRGALSGQAQWRYSSEAGRYRLELQTSVLGQNLSHLRSEGGSSRAGLEPLRFVDGRRGRDRRAVNFQRDAPGGPRISFSGPGHELPLPEGVQDRLSWLLQLAAIVDADPALRRAGAEVSMWVVGPRGDADVWTFEVAGADALRGDDGQPQPALALQRKASPRYDTEVRVWLDPAARHLPLRALWRHDGEGPVVELRRESLAWR
jgi:hypothetical protein